MFLLRDLPEHEVISHILPGRSGAVDMRLGWQAKLTREVGVNTLRPGAGDRS